MYIRSGNIVTGYELCTSLLSCICEAKGDEKYFGATEPDDDI